MTRIVTLVVLAYLLVMTIVGLIIMKADKAKAEKNKWRIKEATLFLISAIGGSLGTWAGMYLFRHKTKHWYFVVGMPLILILHIALLVFLFSKGILAL
ncbi:MAG: DUF1294 domain-containing protein [Lachnospiraceae bacterium]|nr:DUF1294 domain-containing protein [Lachnospiraceae bacterium]MBO4559747.1 DUF1294 domain-containing protein [Lachnospiraceae bacterium]